MFAYLSKKLEMPQGAGVRCVAWSGEDNFLACGCDNGMLKVLKIEAAVPTDASGKDGSGNKDGGTGPATTRSGLLAAPSNIAMNQSLEGHSANIQVIAWNNVHHKLTTSDAKGLIIVWMLYKGTWYEEMVNNRNRSTVRGLAWSHDGTKICIVYEDGGVIVGSADGNRLWGKDLKGVSLAGVTWSPDARTVLFTLTNGEIHVYDSDGNYLSKMKLEKVGPRYDTGDEAPIVAVRWKSSSSGGKGGSSSDGPSLAVIWRAGRISLLRHASDENALIVESGLVASCGDWSPNGAYLAVGGSPVGGGGVGSYGQESTRSGEAEEVRVLDESGKLLQVVRVPGTPLTSLSWDSLSLRLAIGAGAHVYFANLRPLYKFAVFGAGVLAYNFVRSDSSHHLAFWDGTKVTTQEISGRVLDVKGDEAHFAVMSQTASSSPTSYSVSVLNAVGAPIDSLTITTMDPFTMALTDGVLVLLAPNAVLVWRFQSATAHSVATLSSELTARRRERLFHVDDAPKFVPDSGGDSSSAMDYGLRDDLRDQRIIDPAVCCDAKPHIFVLARDSGRLQLYSLPHGVLLNTLDIAQELGIRVQRLALNCDGLQMAMVDVGGRLSVASLSTSSMKTSTLRRYERKDVWSVLWARDDPHSLCLVEKTRIYVMRNGELEEPILSSGYLATFKDLEVTIVLMDEMMQSPETPQKEFLSRVETRSLRDIRSLISNGTALEDVARYVEDNSHPCLWRLLARAALNALDLSIAEAAFVRCREYAGVQFAKKISIIPDEVVRRAEVAAFFDDFETAEKLYLEADRKDLAVEMWRLIGDWKRSEALIKTRQADVRTHKSMSIAMGDSLSEEQEWRKAVSYYEKADDTTRLVTALLMLEDYGALDKLAGTLPKSSPLLPQIGAAFEAVGLTTEAVRTYLACGLAEKAVETAVVLSQWNLAMDLAQKHSLHNVAPVLLRYTGHLLLNGEMMQAVELLRKSDKPFAAGKLLAMLALRELQDEWPNLVLVKKVFVMSAMMFTQRSGKRSFPDEPNTIQPRPQSADLSFESHIPPEFRPSPEEFRWMRETPWRGAEAVHFLCLIQRFIHGGQFAAATHAALHLRNFVDIVGEERVSSLLALAAANNKWLGVASRAFINLELIDEDYSDLASGLFSDHPPKDARGQKTECPTCGTLVGESATSCGGCDSRFPLCTATGRPIMDLSAVWTCDICRHSARSNEILHRRYCPLCHAEITR